MIDLSTQYLGLQLKSPLVVSASPLSESIQNVRLMEDSGAAAIVLRSLFEEQLNLESYTLDRDLSQGTESFAESLSYLPEFPDYRAGSDAYLDHLMRVKECVAIPIIASINGITPGGWMHFAKEVEAAGADAIELNTYALVTDPLVPSNEVEKHLIELVAHVRSHIKIPLAVKLSPQFTSIPNLAVQLADAGANGLVLFNRFYQPDFDIERLTVLPRLCYSNSSELLLRLHWVAILFHRVRADLAITGGVHTAEDVLKGIMAGAAVTMMTSALHQYGIRHLAAVQADVVRWMKDHEYESTNQMRGALSRSSVPDPSPYERGNYIKTLSSYPLHRAPLHQTHQRK